MCGVLLMRSDIDVVARVWFLLCSRYTGQNNGRFCTDQIVAALREYYLHKNCSDLN